MSSTKNLEVSADIAPENTHLLTYRRVDPIDGPARPLGSKRSALEAQKHRQSRAAWRAGLAGAAIDSKGRLLTSADGTLAFVVLPSRTGLLVERRHYPEDGQRVAQTMVFDSVSSFDRWCDSEPARFIDPILHAQLRREGHEALGTE